MNRQTPMEKEDDVRETPHGLFHRLDAEFRFTLDVCATAKNAKCQRFYTESDDGLTSTWEGERAWCNPPFSDIGAWVDKANSSGSDIVVMLVPSTRTEQEWWQRLVEPFRDKGQGLSTRFLSGRQHFLENGGPIYRKNKDGTLWLGKGGKPQRSSPKFGCCLLIWQKDQAAE